jgi:hypothetical protein
MNDDTAAMNDDTARTLQALGVATLEEIENDRWGPAPDDASSLVRRAHQLRTVPLAELGAEGLRLLIGQRVGLDVLVPLAVGMLRTDPLAEGDFYPGDLLASVLRVPHEWFTAHPAVARALDEVVGSVETDATDEYGLPALDETEVPQLLADWWSWRAPGGTPD